MAKKKIVTIKNVFIQEGKLVTWIIKSENKEKGTVYENIKIN